MKIGMVTLALMDLSLERALKTASEIGFEVIELTAKEPHFSGRFELEAIDKIKELLELNNLKISTYGSYWQATGQDAWNDDLENAKEVLSIAKKFNVSIVRVWVPGLNGKGSASATPQVMKNSVAALKEFSKRAADCNLKVAMEMHAHTLIDSLTSIKQVLETANEPNLGLNFQPIIMAGFDDPVNVVRAIGEKIFLCHAANFSSHKEWPSIENDCTSLSDGIWDWESIILELHKGGYKGCIEIEQVKPSCAVEQLKKNHSFLKKYIDTFQSLSGK